MIDLFFKTVRNYFCSPSRCENLFSLLSFVNVFGILTFVLFLKRVWLLVLAETLKFCCILYLHLNVAHTCQIMHQDEWGREGYMRIGTFHDAQVLVEAYRTLHSYKLFWVVCHLFPQQRWRTLTYSVLGNHWPGEPRDLLKTTSAYKFRPAFGASSKMCIFYKYVVFKHPSQWQHTPSSVTQQTSNSNKMDGPRRHTLTMRLFPVSEKPPVSNHKKKDILNM